MAGDVQVSSLKDFMDVSVAPVMYLTIPDICLQLWLSNRSRMDKFSSTIWRACSAISGLHNGFFGQTHSQARLNAVASYDQSNELFKVIPILPMSRHWGLTPSLRHSLAKRWCIRVPCGLKKGEFGVISKVAHFLHRTWKLLRSARSAMSYARHG